MKNNLKVQNLEGKLEPYSSKKIYQSAKNAGANKQLAQEITKKIEKKVYPSIKTQEIFQEIKKLLKEKDPQTYIRFDLKKAIKKLGPTGFLFEKYIKSIFQSRGFRTKINLYFKGKCCAYEIDFLAQKGKIAYVGECKYRNLFESSVDVNNALINQARFLDLKNNNYLKKLSTLRVILVSNGRFTKKAICYSNCVGQELLGWKHPKKNGLEKIIEQNNLYPITILPSLSEKVAKIFVQKKKMLAQDVLKIKMNDFSRKNNITIKELEKIKKEAQILFFDKK